MPEKPPTSAFESLSARYSSRRRIQCVEGWQFRRPLLQIRAAPWVQVAHSFAGGRKRPPQRTRPELFVLDLDPPPSGEIEFFNKLRRTIPGPRRSSSPQGPRARVRAERGTRRCGPIHRRTIRPGGVWRCRPGTAWALGGPAHVRPPRHAARHCT